MAQEVRSPEIQPSPKAPEGAQGFLSRVRRSVGSFVEKYVTGPDTPEARRQRAAAWDIAMAPDMPWKRDDFNAAMNPSPEEPPQQAKTVTVGGRRES